MSRLPLAVTAGLPDKAPRGRSFAVSSLSQVVGPDTAVRVASGRFKTLAEVVAAAEKVDLRLNPQIILVEDEWNSTQR